VCDRMRGKGIKLDRWDGMGWRGGVDGWVRKGLGGEGEGVRGGGTVFLQTLPTESLQRSSFTSFFFSQSSKSKAQPQCTHSCIAERKHSSDMGKSWLLT